MRGLLFGGALAVPCLSALFVVSARAHPGSGIVVDQKGQVFFQDIVGGAIWKIDERGKLSKYADVKGGHWLALDAEGKFSKATPKYYQRITLDGEKPALIHADGGAPLVVSSDGNLYYASGDKDDRPGGLALTRETPDGTRTSFSPALTKVLHQIDDGITGLASGPDGSLIADSSCENTLPGVLVDTSLTPIGELAQWRQPEIPYAAFRNAQPCEGAYRRPPLVTRSVGPERGRLPGCVLPGDFTASWSRTLLFPRRRPDRRSAATDRRSSLLMAGNSSTSKFCSSSGSERGAVSTTCTDGWARQ